MQYVYEKRAVQNCTALFGAYFLQGAYDLAGTQAPGAGVYMGRRAVHHRLDTTNIRLPSSVSAAVRVGDTDTESNSLTAEITFCHTFCTSFRKWILTQQQDNSINRGKKQVFFLKFLKKL